MPPGPGVGERATHALVPRDPSISIVSNSAARATFLLSADATQLDLHHVLVRTRPASARRGHAAHSDAAAADFFSFACDDCCVGKRKLMRYIRQYNKQPKPVKWKYSDRSRRITADSIVTVHQRSWVCRFMSSLT